MWNNSKSLVLSKIFTLVALAAALALMAGGPWVVKGLVRFSINAHAQHSGLFLATLYTGGAVALAMLVMLYALLHNLGRDEVFENKNVVLLRRISWCCFGGGAIALASALYYLPWGLVGLAACFVGLIVRVVKNMMAHAVDLKQENDLTV